MNDRLKELIDQRLASLKAPPIGEDCLVTAAHQSVKSKQRIKRLTAALCLAGLFALASVSALAITVTRTPNEFPYIRYIPPGEMAVADAAALEEGPDFYFAWLQSGDPYAQYFAVNKLVEFYNDPVVREKAIEAIYPLVQGPQPPETSAEEKLWDAAAFALSVLSRTFDHPDVVHLADGTVAFTLFNRYSDYGSYNEVWLIQNDELRLLRSFSAPQMYVKELLPSPDGTKLAIYTCSNKSEWLYIDDLANLLVSPELVGSAWIQVGADKRYTVWARTDFETYCGIYGDIVWLDNDTITLPVSLPYNDMEEIENVDITYHFDAKVLEYTEAG